MAASVLSAELPSYPPQKHTDPSVHTHRPSESLPPEQDWHQWAAGSVHSHGHASIWHGTRMYHQPHDQDIQREAFPDSAENTAAVPMSTGQHDDRRQSLLPLPEQ